MPTKKKKTSRKSGSKYRPDARYKVVSTGYGEWLVIDSSTGKTVEIVSGYENAVAAADALEKATPD